MSGFNIERVRYLSLGLSLTTVATGYLLLEVVGLSSMNPLFLVVRSANAWTWLLTFLGFASHHLDVNSRFLKYANEAVLPFYSLHQTIIVVLVYFIVDREWAVLPKYVFLSATSFVIIFML